MRAEELMTAPLACRPGTDVATAARMMSQGNCGFLAVVGPDDVVVGSVTEHDVATALGARHVTAADLRVEEIMSCSVPTCGTEDTVEDLLALGGDAPPRCFVVTDPAGRLRGILPAAALVQAARGAAERRAQ